MCWFVLKIHKNRSKIDVRSIPKSIINLIAFLINFWSILANFSALLAIKITPKSIKNLSKNQQKNYTILNLIFVDFYRFWPILAPQERLHEGPTNQLLEVIMALGAKMAPRPPKMASRSDFPRFLLIFGRFLIHVWLILAPFLIDFWIIVDWFLYINPSSH